MTNTTSNQQPEEAITMSSPNVDFKFDDNAPPPVSKPTATGISDELVAGAIQRLREKGYCAIPSPTASDSQRRGAALVRAVMNSSAWSPIHGEPFPRFVSHQTRNGGTGEYPYVAYLVVTDQFVTKHGKYNVAVDRTGNRLRRPRKGKA